MNSFETKFSYFSSSFKLNCDIFIKERENSSKQLSLFHKYAVKMVTYKMEYKFGNGIAVFNTYRWFNFYLCEDAKHIIQRLRLFSTSYVQIRNCIFCVVSCYVWSEKQVLRFLNWSSACEAAMHVLLPDMLLFWILNSLFAHFQA